jgi:hypothetical protein
MKEIKVVIEEANLYLLHAACTNWVAVSAPLRLVIFLAMEESFVLELESASPVELRRGSA